MDFIVKPSGFYEAKCVVRQRLNTISPHAYTPDDEARRRMEAGEKFETALLETLRVPKRYCPQTCKDSEKCGSAVEFMKAVREAFKLSEQVKNAEVAKFQQLHLPATRDLKKLPKLKFPSGFADYCVVSVLDGKVKIHVMDMKFSPYKSDYQEEQVICYIIFIKDLLLRHNYRLEDFEFSGSIVLPKEHDGRARNEVLRYTGLTEVENALFCPIQNLSSMEEIVRTYLYEKLPKKLGEGWNRDASPFADIEDTDWKFEPSYCKYCPHLFICQKETVSSILREGHESRAVPPLSVASIFLPWRKKDDCFAVTIKRVPDSQNIVVYTYTPVTDKLEENLSSFTLPEDSDAFSCFMKNNTSRSCIVLNPEDKNELRRLLRRFPGSQGPFFCEDMANLTIATGGGKFVEELQDEIYVLKSIVRDILPSLSWKGPLNLTIFAELLNESTAPNHEPKVLWKTLFKMKELSDNNSFLVIRKKFPKVTCNFSWNFQKSLEEYSNTEILTLLIRQLNFELRRKQKDDTETFFKGTVCVGVDRSQIPQGGDPYITIAAEDLNRCLHEMSKLQKKRKLSGKLFFHSSFSTGFEFTGDSLQSIKNAFNRGDAVIVPCHSVQEDAEKRDKCLLTFYADLYISSEYTSCRLLKLAAHLEQLKPRCTLEPYIKGNWSGIRSSLAPLENACQFVMENPTEQQRAAFNHVLSESPLSVIWGPPGTGKTSTLAHILVSILLTAQKRRDFVNRVLVVAFTNAALDLLYDKMQEILQKLGGFPSNCIVKKDEKKGELAFVAQNDNVVVFRTIYGLCSDDTAVEAYGKVFNTLVVDEASMFPVTFTMLASQFLNPLEHKIILAGDVLQLGPILSNTTLDPLFEEYFPFLKKWSGSILEAVHSPEAGVIPPYVKLLNQCFRAPQSLVNLYKDIYPQGLRSAVTGVEGFVYYVVIREDQSETECVDTLLNTVKSPNLSTFVVTPHRIQRQNISSLDVVRDSHDRIVVETVERHQGGEADCIFLCYGPSVRLDSDFGFHLNRLNVAVSRAKQCVTLVLDAAKFALLNSGAPLHEQKFEEHVKSRGAENAAKGWELLQNIFRNGQRIRNEV